MKRFANFLFIFLLSTCMHMVNGQASRTWVSGVGDDANPCSRTAPCKTLAGAISKTAAGGEISILDPGGFGAFTITKSITINGDGGLGSILSAGFVGISINAAPTDVVTIRNMSILNSTNGSSGINYVSGGTVNIEKCTIQNFATGILMNNVAKSNLTIKNSTITNCSSAAIDVTTTTDTASVIIDNSYLQKNGSGINASTGALVSMSNCTVSLNPTGIKALNNAEVNIIGSTISNNYNGVISNDAASTVRLTGNRIFSNGTGISGSGKVISFGDNKITGNVVNSNTTLSVISSQ